MAVETQNYFLKCPPFCTKKCSVNHHPLLLALINCRSENPEQIQDLQYAVTHYVDEGWDKNSSIPDSVKSYRYPMVHWACALGRVEALKHLIGMSLEPLTVTERYNQTGLHRAIQSFQDNRRVINKPETFGHLLEILGDALLMQDVEGNTPLHVACQSYDDELPGKQNYGKYINKIVEYCSRTGQDFTALVLGKQNHSGSTALHLLCRHDRNFIKTKQLVDSGADINVLDKSGSSPLDVAIVGGLMKTCPFLNSIQKQQPISPTQEIGDDTEYGQVSECDDSPDQTPRIVSVVSLTNDWNCKGSEAPSSSLNFALENTTFSSSSPKSPSELNEPPPVSTMQQDTASTTSISNHTNNVLSLQASTSTGSKDTTLETPSFPRDTVEMLQVSAATLPDESTSEMSSSVTVQGHSLPLLEVCSSQESQSTSDEVLSDSPVTKRQKLSTDFINGILLDLYKTSPKIKKYLSEEVDTYQKQCDDISRELQDYKTKKESNITLCKVNIDKIKQILATVTQLEKEEQLAFQENTKIDKRIEELEKSKTILEEKINKYWTLQSTINGGDS